MSLMEFKESFLQKTLNLIWEQWCVLGLAGHSAGTGGYCIDPEALLLATCQFGRYDPRLFNGMLEWLTQNEGLLSLLRVASLMKKGDKESIQGLKAAAALLETEYRKPRWHKLTVEASPLSNPEPFYFLPIGSSNRISEQPPSSFTSSDLSAFRISKKSHIGSFQMTHPGSLWLRLRSLLGVSTRTDILVYLLIIKNGGHPSFIARELEYTQRGIQQALVTMSSSGWIIRNERSREVVYTVADSLRMLTSSFKESPKWLKWSAFFYMISDLWRTLNDNRLSGLSDEVQSAELRGTMRKAENSLSLLGFSGIFFEARNQSGKEYIDSLAEAWNTLFASLNE
jgi:hypothetical protein